MICSFLLTLQIVKLTSENRFSRRKINAPHFLANLSQSVRSFRLSGKHKSIIISSLFACQARKIICADPSVNVDQIFVRNNVVRNVIYDNADNEKMNPTSRVFQ